LHFATLFEKGKGKRMKAVPEDIKELAGMRVLIVDDDSTSRRILEELVTSWGMFPAVAESGQAALVALWSTCVSAQPFDLLLLDSAMPEMDGFTLAERIRQNQEFAGLRVIMLVSAGQDCQNERCRKLGIDGTLTKPVVAPDFLATVLSGPEDPREEVFPGVVLPAEQVCDKAPAVEQVYDKAAAVEQVDGDEEFLCELAGVFLDNCPQLIDEINGAFETGDCEVLQRAAHTIKGSVGTFCAGPVHDAALKLELIAREEKLDRAPEAFRELEERLAELIPVLTALAAEVAHQ
jgi:two-component system, sensor histidine kinase and response regulator